MQRNHFGRVSNAVAHRAFKTFQYPYRIIFVAGSTRELFEKYNKSNNFALINNVLAPREKTNSSESQTIINTQKQASCCLMWEPYASERHKRKY